MTKKIKVFPFPQKNRQEKKIKKVKTLKLYQFNETWKFRTSLKLPQFSHSLSGYTPNKKLFQS